MIRWFVIGRHLSPPVYTVASMDKYPIIRFGCDRTIRLEAAGNGFVREYGNPRQAALADCALGVREALASPLGYPSPGEFTTADDRIVLAVGTPLPRGEVIVSEVVRVLTESGVNAEGITVLQAAHDPHDDICGLLSEDLRQKIRVLRHDPADRESLAYLATTEAGESIVFNRILTDADLVLPIGCTQDSAASGYFGVNSPLFPAFSDEDTQLRFRRTDREGKKKRQLNREADEVGWLLGVSFTIQVVPGSGDEILHVVAGEIGRVRSTAKRLFAEAWNQNATAAAKLVIATIEGGREQQTWHNLGRAIANAAALAEDDGAIAVFCELAEMPGAAVRELAQSLADGSQLLEKHKNPPPDALPAAQIAAALERNHIYLMSKLDDDLVEELEITPIAAPQELNRLITGTIERGESCIILSNAARAKVSLTDEIREFD